MSTLEFKNTSEQGLSASVGYCFKVYRTHQQTLQVFVRNIFLGAMICPKDPCTNFQTALQKFCSGEQPLQHYLLGFNAASSNALEEHESGRKTTVRSACLAKGGWISHPNASQKLVEVLGQMLRRSLVELSQQISGLSLPFSN